MTRQQFVQPDVGKNKAEIMARRYGGSFGLTIGFIKRYIENPNDLVNLMSSSNHTPVLIDAVDNNKTRLVMRESVNVYADEYGEVTTISSGNEEYAGQVVFSYKAKSYSTSVRGSDGEWTEKTPDLFDIFPTAEIGQLPTELSCAEQAISAPQNIHTNMTAANLMFGFVNKMLNYRPINELVVFFDTNTQKTSTYPATKSGLRDLLTMTPNNGALIEYLGDEEADFDFDDAVYPPTLEEVQQVEKETVEVL